MDAGVLSGGLTYSTTTPAPIFFFMDVFFLLVDFLLGAKKLLEN